MGLDHSGNIEGGGEHIAQSIVDEMKIISTLPEITSKIIAIVDDPNSGVRDLHTVISSDPALSSRVLKVVNSAFYGLPRQIASMNRAVSLLGRKAIKNIAITGSVAQLFRGQSHGKHFKPNLLWEESLATANAARAIADVCRPGISDEAFLAGLIHDIGILVEYQYDPVQFAKAFDLSVESGRDLRICEREIFGADHEDFGKALCESWKFPASLVWVANHHHEPGSVPPSNRDLPCIVHIARSLVQKYMGNRTGDLNSVDLPETSCTWLEIAGDRRQLVCSRVRLALSSEDALLTAA